MKKEKKNHIYTTLVIQIRVKLNNKQLDNFGYSFLPANTTFLFVVVYSLLYLQGLDYYRTSQPREHLPDIRTCSPSWTGFSEVSKYLHPPPLYHFHLVLQLSLVYSLLQSIPEHVQYFCEYN